MSNKDTMYVPADIDSATLLAMKSANPDATVVLHHAMSMEDMDGQVEHIDLDDMSLYSDFGIEVK